MCEDKTVSVAMHDLKDRVDKLEQAVYNGNGRESLMERMASLERQVNAQSKLLWIVLTATIGSLIKSFLG